MNLKAGVFVAGVLGVISLANAQMGGMSPTPTQPASDKSAPANDACGTKKMTKKVDKPLLEAQKARAEKNWDQVIAKVNEAEAVPVEKSVYDMFWVHEFRG